MRSVEGAVAVISGLGSGIGRATALSLARRGAAVVVEELRAFVVHYAVYAGHLRGDRRPWRGDVP